VQGQLGDDMKRREFLAAAALTASGSWSIRTLGQPCPPPSVSISGGTATRASCNSGSKSGPAWFNRIDPLKWTSIAGGPGMSESWQSGDRLAEAVPPGPYFGNWGPRYLTAGWNGACVDPENREMIIALNGGHAAWQYNDAYALDLGSDVPSWRRIVDATPEVDPTDGTRYYDAWNNDTLSPGPDRYLDPVVDQDGMAYARPLLVPGWLGDGPQPQIRYSDRSPDLSRVLRRPRTVHTCSHYHYSNGRVWYPILNAWNQGSGRTSLVKLALDLDLLRKSPVLKSWRYGSPGPWRYIGAITEQTGGDTDTFGFGVAALDSSTGRIWYTGQRTSSYWSMETLGTAAGKHTYYDDAPRDKPLSSSAGAIAYGLPQADGSTTSLFVLMEVGTFRLWVLDTSKAGSGTAWSVVTPVNASRFEWAAGLKAVEPSHSGHPAAYGMVYHASSRCFLAYNCDQLPSRSVVRKLSVPLRADGTYDSKGNWVWSEIVLGGEPPAVNNPSARNIGGGGGSYTRFNIFPDFAGTGEALLVHLSHFNQPTSVCKLPPGMVT